MNSGLQDEAVLITGAAGGIGQATARAFAEEGAKLSIHYHTSEEAAVTLAESLDAESLVLGADLRDETQAESLIQATVGGLQRLDHLVVNAGIWEAKPAPLHEMSLDQWKSTMDANLTSAFLTCRAFLRHVAKTRPDHASIVLVGSTAALFGEADHADYSAAKAGLVYGLTRSLKNEITRLCPNGRVNAVCPGWTNTPMAEAELARPGALARATSTAPLKKVARPEDIAHSIVFLASQRLAGHISGAILPVAGGMEGRLLAEVPGPPKS